MASVRAKLSMNSTPDIITKELASLTELVQGVSKEMYDAAAAANQPKPAAQEGTDKPGDDDIIDADFEECSNE